MDLSDRTALVTGANRGLGCAFVQELLEAGATVWATARHPEVIDRPGVRTLGLDVLDDRSVQAAAEQATDVDLLINNAGSFSRAPVLDGDLDGLHRDMDTHYYGMLRTVRAFAPVLRANGGGGLLNVLSVLSWVSSPLNGGYCAAKAAAWSATNSLRLQLAPQRTTVTALHVGFIDTDMVRGISGAKADARDVARTALAAVDAGEVEIIYDEWSRRVQRELSGGVRALYG